MGRLPAAFALPAGYGDMAVVLLALATVGALLRKKPYARSLAFGVNALGLLDFVSALGTGVSSIGPFAIQLQAVAALVSRDCLDLGVCVAQVPAALAFRGRAGPRVEVAGPELERVRLLVNPRPLEHSTATRNVTSRRFWRVLTVCTMKSATRERRRISPCELYRRAIELAAPREHLKTFR